MYNFGIEKIITNYGDEIIPKKINIIIGPNNCGKSTFLKDIRNRLSGNETTKIIKDIEYILPKNTDEFVERYDLEGRIYNTRDNQFYIKNYSCSDFSDFTMESSIGQHFNKSNIYINEDWYEQLNRNIPNFYNDMPTNSEILAEGDFSENAVVHHQTYVEDTKNGKKIFVNVGGAGGPLYIKKEDAINSFINTYGNLFFNYLGTEEKLLTIRCQEKYGYLDTNTNFLSEVQQKRELLQQLSIETKKLFGKDIYLDRYSLGKKIALRTGEDFTFIRNSSREESEAERRLINYPLLDDEGDGIKGFVASYISLNMDDKNILLLDEPEAFLYPPLARKVGEIIGQVANGNKQVFIATHSPEILKGILTNCDDVNIIRITRDSNLNKITQLEQRDLQTILDDSLLMASSVLNGLFCEKVYIVEADSDERFFQYIFLKVNPFDGSYFVHGQNKQTLKKISDIYNKLGVSNKRIYDFDILRKADEFNDALRNCVEPTEKQKYTDLRKEIEDFIIESGIKKDDAYHKLGINTLNPKLKIKVEEMINKLKIDSDIIIIKTGCLESTLTDVGINFTTNKTYWLIKALEKVGSMSKKELLESSVYKEYFV